MGYVLRYLATALVGTLVIYYGLPRLRPLLPEVIRSMSQPAAAVPARASAPAREPRPATGSRRETPRTLPLTTPAAGRAAPPSAPDAGLPDPAAMQVAAPPPVPAAPSAAPTVVTPLGYTPSVQRIPPSGADITHWGVTLQHAPFFEKDGKRRAEVLPGGTLVEQTDAMSSSKGEMALCRIWRGSGWAGPFLVATADLVRFPGGRDEVDADELEVLLRYAELNARAEARKRELARLGVDANPHTAPLRRLKEAYDAARAQAERLTRERDEARGAERIRLGDELRRVKEQEPRMRRELESLARQYEAWKSSHATPAADPSLDADVQALQAQMQALRPRLGNFGL